MLQPTLVSVLIIIIVAYGLQFIFIVDQAHFTEVYSLDGGIHAYAEQVDPSCGFY